MKAETNAQVISIDFTRGKIITGRTEGASVVVLKEGEGAKVERTRTKALALQTLIQEAVGDSQKRNMWETSTGGDQVIKKITGKDVEWVYKNGVGGCSLNRQYVYRFPPDKFQFSSVTISIVGDPAYTYDAHSNGDNNYPAEGERFFNTELAELRIVDLVKDLP